MPIRHGPSCFARQSLRANRHESCYTPLPCSTGGCQIAKSTPKSSERGHATMRKNYQKGGNPGAVPGASTQSSCCNQKGKQATTEQCSVENAKALPGADAAGARVFARVFGDGEPGLGTDPTPAVEARLPLVGQTVEVRMVSNLGERWERRRVVSAGAKGFQVDTWHGYLYDGPRWRWPQAGAPVPRIVNCLGFELGCCCPSCVDLTRKCARRGCSAERLTGSAWCSAHDVCAASALPDVADDTDGDDGWTALAERSDLCPVTVAACKLLRDSERGQ